MLPGLELHAAAAEAPDPELRPLHVREHADGALQLFFGARMMRGAPLVGVGAVAEVEAEHVGAGDVQPLDHLRRGG